MVKYPIPVTVVKKMEEMETRLGEDFSWVWGLLPTCPERDEIMSHILQAKIKLHNYIEGVEKVDG